MRHKWVSVSRLFSPFHLLSVLLILVFLFGGSARADSMGQLVVVPLSLALLLVGIWRFGGYFAAYRAVGILLGCACLAILIQLIPLPPAIWYTLPGHRQFADVALLSQTQEVWRPANLVPQLGWISFASILTPWAVFALGCGVATSHAGMINRASGSGSNSVGQIGFERLAGFIVGIGWASALLSIFQLLGPSTGPLYLHRITNEGAAVGLFANRNHQAAFLACLLPLLAVMASMPRSSAQALTARKLVLLATAGLVVALLLIGGSRAGIVLAAIGLSWGFLLYRPVETRDRHRGHVVLRRFGRLIGIGFIAGLTLLTVVLSRAESLKRAMDHGGDDLVARTDVWRVTLHQALDFFPIGTGVGAFVESYRVVEPLEQITPYYMNHAHNDWLEVVHGGGLVALGLLVAILLWWAWRLVSLFRVGALATAAGRLSLAGGAIMSILGVASLVDYPLRTAPLAALFTLAMMWLCSSSVDREIGGNRVASAFGGDAGAI